MSTSTKTATKAKRSSQPLAEQASTERVLLYLRISDPDSPEAGIARQRLDGRALAKRNGWTVVDEFPDPGRSASRYARKVRPEFARMLAMVDAGVASRIVAYNLDRLLRNPKELEELIDRADAGKVTITSLQGDIDLSTEDGRFMARVLVAHAAKESDATSRRTRRGKAGARAKGSAGGSVVALGWYGKRHGNDPKTGEPYLDDGKRQHPGEAKLIRRAAADYLAGDSLTRIAWRWNEAGVRCPHGAKGWGTTSVRSVLRNARNAGLIEHGGEHVGPGDWKPILDRETWEAVRARIAVNGFPQRTPRRRTLLTGLVRCSTCGAVMIRSSLRERNGTKRAEYRCRRKPDRPDNCGRMSVDATMLEAYVVEGLLDRADTRDLAVVARRKQRKGATNTAADELAVLQQRMSDLGDMLGAGTLTRAQFERQNVRLIEQAQRLEPMLATDHRDAPLLPMLANGTLRARWASKELTDDQRRAVLAAVIEHITVRPTEQRGRAPFDSHRVKLKFRY